MQRIEGCICELDENGNPVVADYAECPVHKPEAADPKKEAQRIVEQVCLGKALIADNVVNEILSVLEPFQRHEYGKILIPFYQQVKKEIDAL